MKKTLDIKKLILLNMPYILLGLFATNFGEAWRMAQGADASEKFLSLVAVLPGALQSFWPSLHPLDLLVRLCQRPGQQGFLDNRRRSRRGCPFDFPSVYRREKPQSNRRISDTGANPNPHFLHERPRAGNL